MPSRKSHTNSHHGCLQCKARRSKCDQSYPKCTRCAKKNQECTYRHLSSAYDPFQSSSSASGQVTPTTTRPVPGSVALVPLSNVEAQQGGTDLVSMYSTGYSTAALRDITRPIVPSYHDVTPLILDSTTEQLLHHYTTFISSPNNPTASASEMLPFFNSAIKRFSLSQPHVHYALLSYSGLHLAMLERSSSPPSSPPTRSPHLVEALTRRSKALDALRPLIHSLTTANCESALVTSGLLMVSAFALPLASKPGDLDDLSLLTEILTLFQGTTLIFRMGWINPLDSTTSPKMRQSVLVALDHEANWTAAEDAVEQVRVEIVSLVGVGDGGQERIDVLLDAADKLHTALRRVAAFKGVYSVACMWLGMVTTNFTGLVRLRDPLALILLANWSVGLKYGRHTWWTRGWAARTVNAVEAAIEEEELKGFLGWARAEVSSEGV